MSWSQQQSQNNGAIEQIVIVGADVLGWCAAVALARGLQGQNVSITVVESSHKKSNGNGNHGVHDNQGIIHASAHLFDFHQLLGIQDKQLLAKGQAKLCSGSQFFNFSQQHNQYVVGCEKAQPSFCSIELHHVLQWLGIEDPTPYSLSGLATEKTLLALPTANSDEVTAGFSPRVNLDAATYQRFMQGAAIHLGVMHQQAAIQQIDYHVDSGFIQQLTLTNGETLQVDLLVNNSHDEALFRPINQQRQFKDCRSLLAFDRKITTVSTTQNQAKPYQQFHATEHGVCELNFMPSLHSATLHYAAEHTSDKQAQQQLAALLDHAQIDNAQGFDVTHVNAGYNTNCLHKNCFAIGDNAGYLGTSPFSQLILLQRSISKLLELFPGKACLATNSAELNRRINQDYQQALHYSLLMLNFSEQPIQYYWQAQIEQLPEALQQKIRLFRSSGRVSSELNPLVSRDLWITMLKYKVRDNRGYEPVLDALDKQKGLQFLQQLKQRIAQCLSHYRPYQ
ncbi:tryptophan 7-halogenase [Alteromonadaceae bacterium BrNp21-10]|nr:tryptophan 7-halogenase [Alteromonadaceae bacterium BrNp21-10]